MRLTQHTVDGFLDALAARTPAPGGGAVAGLAGALAAALGRMVAEYTRVPDGPVDPQVAKAGAGLARADHMLRELLEEDARAYGEYRRTARPAAGDAGAEQARQAALGLAVAVPLEIAAVCGGVLTEFDAFAPLARHWLLSDLAGAAVLAEAAARCAGCTVRVNVGRMDEASARDCLERLTAIEAQARKHLQQVLSVVEARARED